MFKQVGKVKVVLLIVVLITAVITAWSFINNSSLSLVLDRFLESEEIEAEIPGEVGTHIAKLREAIPGIEGMAPEGPGSATEESFLQKAYPLNDIPLAQIEAERSAAKSAQNRGFPSGKGRPGTWVSIGPSSALYPFNIFRNYTNYVPDEYIASGRTTVVAISSTCTPGNCRLYIAAAGGGIWRTNNALAGTPSWKYVSGSFGINAVSSITIDPNDASGKTIWVGTGEANASGDSAAGVGLYKSTNGGDSWTGPIGQDAFNGRAVGSITIMAGDSNTVYAASTRGVRGVSSVTGGAVSLIPGAPRWGLYKSTNGGQSWTFIHNGSADPNQCTGDATEANNGTPCSPRGVRRIAMDPTNANTIYASSYARGIWRSTDGGANWTQIKASLNAGQTTTRAEIAVTTLPNGNTRMYVGEGNTGAPYARLFRSDNVATGAPVFTDMTVANFNSPSLGSYNYCTGQCWYDQFVYTPAGHPDMVYLGGSYQYGETASWSNGRAVVLSTDGGVSWSDMTMDATDSVHPNGLHPDQHDLVTNPNNPFQFFESNDGGVMRSSGEFADITAECDARGLSGGPLTACQNLLWRVPTELEGINKGLTTLQFQSLSVSPHNVNIVQGGTQDNGTWQTTGNPNKWLNTIIGDGGQSGFDADNPAFRFHTYFNATAEVNFSEGDQYDWNWIADQIYGTEPQAFYVPIISDPSVGGTMYVGTSHVWRTKTHGMGSMTLEELRQHCNTWTGDFAVVCGDWVPLGDPGTAGWLTAAAYGDRAGGTMAAVERTTADSSSMWAATSTGRVFVSKNVDAEPAASVVFTRIDSASTPGRFVSGIYVDPANGNHAWVSYSGYDAATPATPGHVFEVTFDPNSGTAVWTDRSYNLGDMPMTDVAYDDVTGDVYASSDFGVYRLVSGSTSWTLGAPGMPNVEVAGITMMSGERKLFAATHGMGAWLLNLK